MGSFDLLALLAFLPSAISSLFTQNKGGTPLDPPLLIKRIDTFINELSFTCFYPVIVPSLPPGNVTAFNTSSTTITVTWSKPRGKSVQGVLLGYEITFTPAWKNASASRRVMLCRRNTTFLLERLLKYTLYNITVAAFTKVGIGKESEIEQTWTDEDSKCRLT